MRAIRAISNITRRKLFHEVKKIFRFLNLSRIFTYTVNKTITLKINDKCLPSLSSHLIKYH